VGRVIRGIGRKIAGTNNELKEIFAQPLRLTPRVREGASTPV